MTKKLEDLFDLPEAVNLDEDSMHQPVEATVEKEIEVNKQQLQRLDIALDKIDAALPTVRNLATSDTELDELATMASDSFKALMELGMNVEPKHGAEIFATASSLLSHAIHAKNAKMTNKLRIVQLQIQKARLDMQKTKADLDEPPEGEATQLDRNELLKMILEEKKK